MSSGESLTEFANLNLSDFLTSTENSSSDNSINDFCEQKRSVNMITTKLDAVRQLQYEKQLSYVATSSVVELMNEMSGTSIELPTSTNIIRTPSFNQLKLSCLMKCLECDEICEANTKCKCGRILKKDSKKK